MNKTKKLKIIFKALNRLKAIMNNYNKKIN